MVCPFNDRPVRLFLLGGDVLLEVGEDKLQLLGRGVDTVKPEPQVLIHTTHTINVDS